jgi:hypothetical protein
MANPAPSQSGSRASTNSTLVNAGINLLPSDDPLRIALDKFVKDNPKENLTKFSKTSYSELCNSVKHIQRAQNERREMMNMTRIQSFLEAMEQFGKIVEVFLNVADLLAFVWGPMKLLLQVFFSTLKTQPRACS